MSRVLSVASIVCVVVAAACGGTKPVPAAATAAPGGAAAQAAPAASSYTGTVEETMNSAGYTYARLKADGKEEVWIAAAEFPTTVGDRLTVPLEMPMKDFQSKTLNRTFPLVYFVGSVSRDGQPLTGAAAKGNAPPMMASHGSAAPAVTTVEPIAAPAGGLSIADVWAKRAALAGKDVTVRGKVVKVNTAIMGKNWIHLQDGSGKAEDRTNDLTVTSDADVKVGDVITVTGVLAVKKDFGAGYSYEAILEQAKIK